MADGTGGFTVDEAALRAAARGIRGTVERAGATETGPVGPLVGHEELGAALDGFLERWRHGIELLAADGRAMAEQLEADARAYRTLDDTGRGAFGGPLHGEGLDPAAG